MSAANALLAGIVVWQAPAPDSPVDMACKRLNNLLRMVGAGAPYPSRSNIPP